MEADKSQDLQDESAVWRLRRGDGIIPVQRLAASRPRKSQCFSSSLKAGKKKNQYPSLKAVRQERIFSYLEEGQLFRTSTDWIGSTHIREGNLLYSFTDLNVKLSQNAFTETPRRMFGQYLGTLWPSQGDT